MRTLLLDDDPIFLAVAESCLSSFGAVVIKTTTDASVVFDTVRNERIELIILDLNMPGLDGLAVLRSLSQLAYKGALIIVSGEKNAIVASAGVIGSKLGLNICGAIAKPVDMKKLRICYDQANAAMERLKRDGVEVELSPRGTLEPFYKFQPQINLVTGKLAGFEALLRGRDDDGQVFGPSAVLLGKPAGLSDAEFSMELFSIFCADVAVLRNKGFTNRFSFNANALTLESPQAFGFFVKIAKDHGLDPRGIVIELIESHLPKDEAWLLEVIARLGIAGFDISMDDFSTGASSFDLLQAGAFSEVKLDAKLIQKSATDSAAVKFIAGVVAVAKELDIRLIAEGVECLADVERMHSYGIEYMQGYFISKPAEKDELRPDYDLALA